MPNKVSRFWQEVKRRNVHRSLAVYAGTSYVIFEASSIIFPRWGLPDWTVDVVLYLLIAGLFITCIVSWIYDVTPEGVQKTAVLEDTSREDKRTVSISWKIATYASLVVIAGLILFNIVQRNQVSRDLRNLEKIIAVLPFENWNSDEEFSYLGDAIANEINTQLAKIEGFHVISFTSSSQFKGPDKPSIREIGKALGAKIVIEGSLERQGEDVSIQVQVIQSTSDNHLWADEYKGKWKDIFEIRAGLALSVAKALKTALSPEEEKQILTVGTQNTEAYHFYLKGNYLVHQLDAENCRKGIENYRQAIALDSIYAQPYAGMAMAYFMLTSWENLESGSLLLPTAKEWAFKALELNENLGDPYYVLGSISFMHEWDWEAAEKAYKTGMQLNPDHIWGRCMYSNLLYMMRRFEEAISISEHTLKLDPLNPLPYMELGGAFWWNGQKEKAYELYMQGLELNPDSWNFKRLLSVYYLEKGINTQFIHDYCEGMLEEFENKGIEFQNVPAFRLGDLGYLYAQVGRREEAVRIYNELERRLDEGQEDTSYMWMGMIQYVWEDIVKSLDLLEKAYEGREDFIFGIMVVPEFNDEELRSHPRFQALIRKMGFETG
jgi:TolB-like protein